MSTNTSSADYRQFEELAEEFAARFRRGERPSLQEYIDRCPDLADEIPVSWRSTFWSAQAKKVRLAGLSFTAAMPSRRLPAPPLLLP